MSKEDATDYRGGGSARGVAEKMATDGLDTLPDKPASLTEYLARPRAIARRIMRRVRKAADDTGTDLPALPPSDAETVRVDGPPGPVQAN